MRVGTVVVRCVRAGYCSVVTESIFSFGTLQSAAVQQSLFSRVVPSTPDLLAGWTIGEMVIVDPVAIKSSGTNIHPALLRSENSEDVVPGVVLDVTAAELMASDEYERVSFRRISVQLESGRAAWVYVPREKQ
jgi:hypothetical protein